MERYMTGTNNQGDFEKFAFMEGARIADGVYIGHTNDQRKRAKDEIQDIVDNGVLSIQDLAALAAKYPTAGDIIFSNILDQNTKKINHKLESGTVLTPTELTNLFNVKFTHTWEGGGNDPSMDVYQDRESAVKTDFFMRYSRSWPETAINWFNETDLGEIGCSTSVQVRERDKFSHCSLHTYSDNLVLLMLQGALAETREPIPSKIFDILYNQKNTSDSTTSRDVRSGNDTIGQSVKLEKPSDLIAKVRNVDPKSWQNYTIGSFGEQAQFIQNFYAGNHSSYSINQGMNDLKNLSLNEDLMVDENIQALRRAYTDMLNVDPHTVGMYKKSSEKFRQSTEGQIFNGLVI
jgi:hypothetical protein